MRYTYELNIFDDQTHPILIAEALNTMLEDYTDYEHRFYPMCSLTTAGTNTAGVQALAAFRKA